MALGGHPEPSLLQGCAMLIVLSPGVPNRIPLVKAGRAKGVPVFSEVELAFQLSPRRWLAVTGTNGKTTTTSLLHAMFVQANFPALLGGNIGEALADRVESAPAEAAVVAELSSFQLEDIQTLKPFVAVWTNQTPDHLDRYRSMEAYTAAKARIFENMDARDHLVFNAMDAGLWKLALSQPFAGDFAFQPDGQEVQAVGAWELDGISCGCAFPEARPMPLMPLAQPEAARAAQPGKRAGCGLRRCGCWRPAPGHRCGIGELRGGGAPPGSLRRNRWRALCQRQQGHQRGLRGEGPAELCGASALDPGRPGQGGRLQAPGVPGARPRGPGSTPSARRRIRWRPSSRGSRAHRSLRRPGHRQAPGPAAPGQARRMGAAQPRLRQLRPVRQL